MPGFESYHNSQKLFSGGTITLLMLIQAFTHISNHTLMAVLIL